MRFLLASLALLAIIPLGGCNLYFHDNDDEDEVFCEGDSCNTKPEGCYDDYDCAEGEFCALDAICPLDDAQTGSCLGSCVPQVCPEVDVDCPPSMIKTCPLNGCEADCTCEFPAPAACSSLPESACIARDDCTPLSEGVDCVCDDQGCTCNDWDFVSCSSECQLANTIEAEDASKVQRVGSGWAVFTGAVLHEDNGLEASVAGGVLNFSIYGSGLTVHHGVGPNRHEFAVSVDGAPAVVVDSNAPEFDFQVASVIASGLSLGFHTVQLECLSTICAIDYFSGASCP